MEHKLGIVVLFNLCLVLTFFFLFSSYQMSFTGFAVLDESSESSNLTNIENVETKVVTEQDALLAINESEKVIQEMIENNFSVSYVSDVLIDSKKVFEQVKYAEVLRNDSSSNFEKSEASRALALINWRYIGYEDVLVYTEEIKQRREEAFLLADEIMIEDSKINEDISEKTREILEEAKVAFYEDRYNDSKNFLVEFRVDFENEMAQASTLAGVTSSTKNFFEKYWVYVIIFLVVCYIFGYFIYKKVKKKIIKKKIEKMKAENEVLTGLMKKSQEDRFKKNVISGLVYNIRMKKYQDRLEEIKQELPVLESRLNKVSGRVKSSGKVKGLEKVSGGVKVSGVVKKREKVSSKMKKKKVLGGVGSSGKVSSGIKKKKVLGGVGSSGKVSSGIKKKKK